MPFSFRLDRETEAIIRRLASKTGWSRSQVVREAVAHYRVIPEVAAASPSALDRVRAYVGVVDTGGAQYSRDTHAKYRELLRRKRRDRHPR
jgi:predicted transcriptional regulator